MVTEIRHYFLLGIFLVLIAACGDNTSSTTATPDRAEKKVAKDLVLIFLDKTLSLTNDDSKFEQPIRNKLFDLMDLAGDRVTLHFVHANTAGAQAVVNVSIDATPPTYEEQKDLGERGKQEKIDKYLDEIRSQRNIAADKIKVAFSTPNPESTNRQTDLWSTLEIMSRTFAAADPIDNKQVFFVSDMQESVKGKDRRDFTRQAPADKTEAQTWSNEDLAIINQLYDIKPNALKGAQIAVFLPYTATEGSDFQTIRYYWEALFRNFEIDQVEVKGIEIE